MCCHVVCLVMADSDTFMLWIGESQFDVGMGCVPRLGPPGQRGHLL